MLFLTTWWPSCSIPSLTHCPPVCKILYLVFIKKNLLRLIRNGKLWKSVFITGKQWGIVCSRTINYNSQLAHVFCYISRDDSREVCCLARNCQVCDIITPCAVPGKQPFLSVVLGIYNVPRLYNYSKLAPIWQFKIMSNLDTNCWMIFPRFYI